MAILSWTKLNPTVKLEDTTKKFFKQYLYRARLYLPGGRLTQGYQEKSMSELIAWRKQMATRYINYGGSWLAKKNGRVNDMRLEDLVYWRTQIRAVSEFHFRIEEPWMCVYSNSESDLYNLIKQSPSQGRLLNISTPKNTDSVRALKAGEVLVKSDNGYSYRIHLKEGKMTAQIAAALLSLLESQGDEVKMTKSCEQNLRKRNVWFTKTYFYSKDLRVLTMINLIDPDIVSEFFKLTKIDR
jgi:hypothetical protein